MKDILIILCSVALAAIGQISLKQGMHEVGKISANWTKLIPTMLRALVSPYILLGLALYGVSTIIWLFVLSRVKLSFAYPMVSTSYILVVLLSRLLFKEEIPLTRLIGVVVICIGVILVSRGAH